MSTRIRPFWSDSTGRPGDAVAIRCGQVSGWLTLYPLPTIVSALNNDVTHLAGKKPLIVIKTKKVAQKPFSVVVGHAVGLEERKLPSIVGVHNLYQPGELEGGRHHMINHVWSIQVYQLMFSVGHVLYDLLDRSTHRFIWEELLVVPHDTQWIPDGVLIRLILQLAFYDYMQVPPAVVQPIDTELLCIFGMVLHTAQWFCWASFSRKMYSTLRLNLEVP